MSHVYSVGEDSSTKQLERIACTNEDKELQRLLENNLDLLPGEQINPGEKLRWFPFTHRYRVPTPVVVTARAMKNRILALKLNRGESEIITFSAGKVKVEPAEVDAATAYHAAKHAAERSGETRDRFIVENRVQRFGSGKLRHAKSYQGQICARKYLLLIQLISINVLPVIFEKRMIQNEQQS